MINVRILSFYCVLNIIPIALIALEATIEYYCSNGAKFSLFYYMCSVLNYLYSV